ncbi:t-SNARE [Meredithblackwellia eburnea MCA 4105]
MELEQGNANLRALIPVGQSLHKLSLQDVDVRQSQVSALKERFKDSIQKYAEVERDSRAKNRSRMERQVKIVNPSLNPDEVQNVVRQAEEGGGNLFSQALLQSNGQRSYAARGALREVESRAAELARIEQTLIELAQLFNDMAMMVEAQDVQIVQIEQQAEVVHKDVEKGLEDTKKAVVSARSARKLRWWCFGIILVILIIVAIVVVVEVVIPLINKNKGSSSSGSHTTTVTQSSTATPTAAAASASSNVFSISSNALYISGSGNGGFLPASTQRF